MAHWGTCRQGKTHALCYSNTHDSRSRNRRHKSTPFFSGTGFWYVSCIPDPRFIWYPISAPIRTLFYSKPKSDDLWSVDDNLLRFNVFYCGNLITNYEFVVYVVFSHIYFWRQRISSKWHISYFWLKCTKFYFGWCSATNPAGGGRTTPQTS